MPWLQIFEIHDSLSRMGVNIDLKFDIVFDKISNFLRLKNSAKLVMIILPLAAFACEDNTDENTVGPPAESSEYVVGNMAGIGEILRTPESNFNELLDYDFEPNYLYLEADSILRMHYLDEGPTEGKVVLLLHGNPSWVYNFRELIPLLVAEEYRVIAPDLIGFGRSDKPAEREAHTYDNHVKWIAKFITSLNLQQINLHCQDWGGLIGLRVAVLNQGSFSKIAISNTSLPDGTNVTQTFLAWRNASQSVNPYSSVMERATFSELSILEEEAYDAPFPAEMLRAGPRELPLKVPISTDEEDAVENAGYWEIYASWDIPILTVFSEEDNISAGEQERIIAQWKGAEGQDHQVLANSSHFIREDRTEQVAEILSDFFK